MGARHADRQRRLQKKLERSRARLQKRRDGRAHTEIESRPAEVPSESASWPIHECLVDPCWRTPPSLVTVLVARRGPTGEFAAAAFLMDLGCLGAKNGFARLLSTTDYSTLRKRVFVHGREPCDLPLAAKIVRSGIAYAERLGFRPHPDVLPALELLGPAQACEVEVPLGGHEGKPCFVCGPDDDPARVIGNLRSRLGPEGFHFGAPLPPREARDLTLDDDDRRDSGPGDDVRALQG